MAFSFRQLIRRLGPGWLVKDRVREADGTEIETDSRVLYSPMAMFDALAKRVELGVQARMPGLAPEDALPHIGRTFTVLRGPQESVAGYEARLQAGIDSHRVNGSPWALLEQLRGYCSPHAVKVRIYNNHGNCFTIDRTGARSIVEATAWNWDGQMGGTLFGRFWVLIYPTVPVAFTGNRFTLSGWTFTNASIGATGVLDPDDGTKGITLYDSAPNAHHKVSSGFATFVAGQPHSVEVYAKMAGVRYCWIEMDSSPGAYVYFDLQNGAVTAEVNATGKISPVGNGYYKCVARFPAPTSGTAYVGMSTTNGVGDYVGTGAQGITIYKPTVTSTYTTSQPWNRTTQKWGDATRWVTGKWGGDSGTWGSNLTREEVSALRQIVQFWKPAGTKCHTIMIVFDDDVLAPTDTAPPLPAGTWETTKYVGQRQVPRRIPDAIYITPRPS